MATSERVKCRECNGYGDDGDAPCQRCGQTGVDPASTPNTEEKDDA